MSKHLFIALLTLLLFCGHNAFCYEVGTHEEITKRALIAAIGKRDFLTDIGYKYEDRIKLTFTTYDPYSDVTSDNGTFTQSLLEWMQYGSKSEDNTISETLFRYRNHFYDPVNNKGYQYGVLTGEKAPDWALEDNGTYSLQYWSIQDAKSYYISALTSSTKTERDNNLAKTFKALGHVIHTVEDMAQPQHTKNDSHASGSMYEKQVNKELSKQNFSSPYQDKVTFDSYRKFYTSRVDSDTPGDGRGLADFSNRSFVTEGTNFSCTNFDPSNPFSTCLNAYYSNPVLEVSLKEEVAVSELVQELQITDSTLANDTGYVTFFGNTITDAYSGKTFENSRMTTYSIFDKDLQARELAPAFTLNRANYNKMAEYLLPRAVGYSAGLLNYFFRGRMDIVKDQNTSGSYIIKNGSDEMMDGVFSLYYDDVNDKRYLVNSWNLSGSNAIPPHGQSSPVSFAKPTSPQPKEKGKYTLVFQGKLGNEIGAGVGKVVSGLCDGTWVEVVNQSCKSTVTYNPNSYPCTTTLCWNGCFTTGLLYYEQIAGGIKENWSYYKTCYNGSCSGCTFTISPSTCPPVPVSDPGCGSYSSGVGGIVEDFNTINYTKYEWRCP